MNTLDNMAASESRNAFSGDMLDSQLKTEHR